VQKLLFYCFLLIKRPLSFRLFFPLILICHDFILLYLQLSINGVFHLSIRLESIEIQEAKFYRIIVDLKSLKDFNWNFFDIWCVCQFWEYFAFESWRLDNIRFLCSNEQGWEGQLTASLVKLVDLVYLVLELVITTLGKGLNLPCVWTVENVFRRLSWVIDIAFSHCVENTH
jgi:hypothetical protein